MEVLSSVLKYTIVIRGRVFHRDKLCKLASKLDHDHIFLDALKQEAVLVSRDGITDNRYIGKASFVNIG